MHSILKSSTIEQAATHWVYIQRDADYTQILQQQQQKQSNEGTMKGKKSTKNVKKGDRTRKMKCCEHA